MGEVRLASEENKKFQADFSMMRSFDAQGGHLETKGISPEGAVIDVPLHRHHVTLNIFRVDVGLKYHLRPRWRLEANVSYETKTQEATIEEIKQVSPAQREAILHNQNNHHRSETYTGPTDMNVLLGHQVQGLFRENDFLLGRIGTTIPLGKTEEDPWKLGDAGLEHLHIQFGTGTFNPIADVRYSLPVYGGVAADVSLRGKLPFYENSKTYRGSREVTYTAGLNYRLNAWLSLRTSYLGFYQSYAYWAGERDINTGLRFSMASVGASVVTPYNIPLSITFVLPLQQETLYDDSNAFVDDRYEESDAFELGPLVSLTVSYPF